MMKKYFPDAYNRSVMECVLYTEAVETKAGDRHQDWQNELWLMF
jgi:hypothetical protein